MRFCLASPSRVGVTGRLPLQRNLRLAVLGPLRNATEELLGNYQARGYSTLGKVADGILSLLPCPILSPSSEAWPVHVISPVEGLKKVPKWMEGTPNFGAKTFHGFGLAV